jgi:hypothetical protein
MNQRETVLFDLSRNANPSTDKYGSTAVLASILRAITLSHGRSLTLTICKSETGKPIDKNFFTID